MCKGEKMGKIDIITDADGKKIVIINDLRFKSKRGIDWNEVEKCLKEYVGRFYEIAETAEKVFIGTDFPDEFAHSENRKRQIGLNAKAKANMVDAIEYLVINAVDKKGYPDYEGKHGNKAKYGWYRYDTWFAIPAYNDAGELIKYNVFKTRMLVRHDANGKMYLYDFLRIKREDTLDNKNERMCRPL